MTTSHDHDRHTIVYHAQVMSTPTSLDEGELHRAGLLQPRSYAPARTPIQPRSFDDIRDSTVQLSAMPFSPPSRPSLQEPPTSFEHSSPSGDFLISTTSLDYRTNDTSTFPSHHKAPPSFPPTSPPPATTCGAPLLSTNASQPSIANPGPMMDEDGESAPVTPSALSLLLARKLATFKDRVGTPPAPQSFSPNLPPIEEHTQSPPRAMEGQLGSPERSANIVAQSETRLTNYEDKRLSQPGLGPPRIIDESTPLLDRANSSLNEPMIGRDPGPDFHKNPSVHTLFKGARYWWERLEPLCLNHLSKVVVSIPSVVLGTLLNVLDGLSYGMIIFPATGVFTSLGGMGVSMFFVSTVIAQLVFTLGGSNFAGANGSMMIEVVPFFHILASTIARDIGEENVREVIATTLVAFALSSFLTGLSFLLLGYLRLGLLIGFFPRHILVGCIGGVGVFLILTGLTVSTRLPSDALDPPTLETLRYFAFNVHALAQWIPPLILAILLRVITTRWKHQLLFPIYFLVIPTVFYIVVVAADLDFDALRKDGWLFESAQGSGDSEDKWYGFYSYFDLELIRWTPIWKTLPTQFALLFFNILHPPLNVPSLSVSLDQDIDTNRELVGHGYSNILSGLFGTVPNYLVYVNTLLFYRLGGGNRVASFLLAVVTFVLLVVGTGPIAYIPVVVVSALIFVLGIDLVKEALWDTRHRVNRMEYITMISIIVTMTVWDFVIGVFLGIIASCFFFVVQNSQRRSIRVCYTGDSAMSTVRRPAAQRAYIRDVSKQTRIIQLQGFLFFGTIVHVEDTLRSIVEDPNWRKQPVRFVIVDLTLVAGVDMSSAEAFVRVQRLLAAKGVVLVFCGVTIKSSVAKALASCGILEEPQVELFETLNDALEWTENAYLSAWLRVQHLEHTPITLPGRPQSDVNFLPTHVGSPREAHILDAGHRTIAGELLSRDTAVEPLNTFLKALQPSDDAERDVIIELVPSFERISVSEGYVLWEIGDPPDGLYVIQSGILRASYKFAAHTSAIEESMVSGTLAGELSGLSGLSRNARVVVERHAVLWKLSWVGMRQLEQDHPYLAQTFVRLVLRAAKVDTDMLLAALVTR